MQGLKQIFCILFLISSSTLYSAEVKQLPDDLMYKGKPISPLCIEGLFDPKVTTLDLENCRKESEIKIESVNEEWSKEGFIGYNYSYKGESRLIYYRYLRPYKRGNMISTIYGDGMNGFYSKTDRLKRQDRHIQFDDKSDDCHEEITLPYPFDKVR